MFAPGLSYFFLTCITRIQVPVAPTHNRLSITEIDLSALRQSGLPRALRSVRKVQEEFSETLIKHLIAKYRLEVE